MSKVPNYFMGMDSKCSCSLPPDCRGSQGWHFMQTQHSVTGADQVTAYERCATYWQAAGRQVDPLDRRQLLSEEKQKGRAVGVKA